MEKQKWYDAVLASLDRMKNIHDLVENEFRNTVQRLLYSADGIARPDDFAVTASAPPDGYVVIPAHTAVQGGQMIAVDTPESVPVLITPIGKPAPFAGSGLNRYTSIFVRYLDGVDRVEGEAKAEWFVDDTTSPPTPYQDTVDTLYLDDYEVIVRHSADSAIPTPVSTPVGYIRYADVYVGEGVGVIAADKITTMVDVYGALDELIYKVNNKVVSWGEITDKPSTFAPSAHTMDGAAHTGTLSAARHGTVSGAGLHPFTAISGTITDAQHGTRLAKLGTALLHPEADGTTPGFLSVLDWKKIQSADISVIHKEKISPTATWPVAKNVAFSAGHFPAIQTRWRGRNGAVEGAWIYGNVDKAVVSGKGVVFISNLQTNVVQVGGNVQINFTPVVDYLIGGDNVHFVYTFSGTYKTYFYLPDNAFSLVNTWTEIEVEYVVLDSGRIA